MVRQNFREPETQPPPTSIRLKARTRAFIDATAEEMGLSTQAVIGLILDGVAETSLSSARLKAQVILDRLHLLFDSHRIDLPGAAELLQAHGITMSVLRDDDRLLDGLSPAAIEYVCETFHVDEAWLRGARDWVVSAEGIERRWYKQPENVAHRMLAYNRAGARPQLMIVRRTNANFDQAREVDDQAHCEPIGAVLRLQRALPSGVEFQTFDVLEFERWNYWRCREQIKLLIAWADAAGFLVTGHELETAELEAVARGQVLPISILSRRTHVEWYPTDFASLTHEVDKEAGEWPAIRKQLEDSKQLQELLNEVRRRI